MQSEILAQTRLLLLPDLVATVAVACTRQLGVAVQDGQVLQGDLGPHNGTA